MGSRWLAGLLFVTITVAQEDAIARECAPSDSSVRVMMHEPDLLLARLRVATAARSDEERVAALRKLHAAAGCLQLTAVGGTRRPDLVCTVPGTTDRSIVVGANLRYDSPSSAALLASLAEALAAAPRRHTFRWVAFSPHETREDRTEATAKPKGAKRMLDAMSEDERARVDAMIHVGPLGFGPIARHPIGADDRLQCPWESAARAAGLELLRERPSEGVCRGGYFFGSSELSQGDCDDASRWWGGNDWRPFRRAGIRVFGVHSGESTQLSGKLDGALYVKSYRMLAIFLALADDALGAGAPAK